MSSKVFNRPFFNSAHNAVRKMLEFFVLTMALWVGTSQAHNLNQVDTVLAFDKATLTLMASRGGTGQPMLQAGDTVGVVLKSTPGPGTATGAGGYMTFYIPPGTQVMNAEYGTLDSTGNFVAQAIKGPSIMAVGDGSIGLTATPGMIGAILPAIPGIGTPGLNAAGVQSTPVTASGSPSGTLAGVYGDTGIFYSTSPDTVWQSFTSNGGYDGNTGTSDSVLTNNSGVAKTPTTKWDAEQLIAYGLSSPSAPVIDPNGRGNTPWGLGSGVAGPQSGYAWAFKRSLFQSTGNMKTSIVVGPWQRIQYAGSSISKDVPGTKGTALGYAISDASTMGVILNPANPLPPTLSLTDSTSPKAIRVSEGGLVLGHSEYARVQLKIIANIGQPNSPFAADGCFEMNTDAFGGDAGGEQGGKDHLWRYYAPTTQTVHPCAMVQKVFTKSLLATGTNSSFQIAVINTGVTALNNVVVTDPMPSGLTYLSASPAPSSTSPLTWSLGTMPANSVRLITVNYQGTGTGTLYNTASMSATRAGIAVTASGIDSVTIGAFSDLTPTKSVTPSTTNPGGSVTYTMTITNDGSSTNGTPLAITENLPAGFTYQTYGSAQINGGAAASGVVTVNSTNPAAPIFSISQGILPGKTLTITFTAAVSAGQAAGVYGNSISLNYESKVVTSGVLAPVTVGGARIGDTVFRDWNSNGVQDATDEGISGLNVLLFASNGTTQLKSTTTDSNGQYLFTGLSAGTYVVKVTPPASYTPTYDLDGIGTANQATVTIIANQVLLTADFGYKPGGTGVIGDQVFNDQNKDAAFNGSDTGISNVTMKLYRDLNGNGLVDATDALVTTTTTNGSGIYSFTGLATGLNYAVVADQSSAGFTAFYGATPFATTTGNPQAVTNLAGTYNNADFGFWAVTPGSIGDTVFKDQNVNSVFDAGDIGIPGLTVQLYRDTNGNGVADVTELVTTATTDANGRYLFSNLGPDSYIVKYDTADADIPGGYVGNIQQIAVTLASGQNVLTADFPFSRLITKTVDKATAVAGNTLNYTITPSFLGNEVLQSLTITDPVPAGTTFVSANMGGTQSGGTVTWNLGSTIPPDPGVTLTNVALYAFTGGPAKTYNSYDPTGNTWSTAPTDTPDNISSGGALATDGTNIYALEGNNTTLFKMYNASSNTWTGKANTPANVKTGGSLVYVSPYFYALGGNNTTNFWRYDTGANTWTAMATTPTGAGTSKINAGGALAYDGTYIYALSGNGKKSFYRYNIATNAWSKLANTPANVSSGGALAFDGTYLYAFEGNNTNVFWRYDRTANTWATRTVAPAKVGAGGALVYSGGSLYALQGNSATGFWRYNTSSNSWTTLAVTTTTKDGGALVAFGTPATYTVELQTNRTAVVSGTQITVTATIGSAINITNVAAPTLSTTVTGGASATLASGPTPATANITAGGQTTFSWTYNITGGASTPGTVKFTNASYSSGSPAKTFPASTSNSLIVTQPLTLAVTVNTPLTVTAANNIANIVTKEFTGCFFVANSTSGGTADRLIKETGGIFTDVGATGTTSLRALTFDPDGVTLWGADFLTGAPTGSADYIGNINTTTGAFTPFVANSRAVDATNTLRGSLGTFTSATIVGLTVDPTSGNLFAIGRREDSPVTAGNTLLDIMFQIDPVTGIRVIDAFGAGVDYVAVATNALATPLYNIDDISFDPLTGDLYAIANDSTAGISDLDRLITIDPVTGVVTDVARITNASGGAGINGIGGFSIEADGSMEFTTSSASSTPNRVWSINRTTGAATQTANLATQFPLYTDFQAVACVHNPLVIPLTPTQVVQTALTGSIGDTVYADINGNGVQDSGEPGLMGVSVSVTNGVNTYTTTTDSSGNYRIFGLTAGTWTVSIDPASFPSGYTPTTATTVSRTLASGTSQINDADFGLRPPPSVTGVTPSSIGDTVWLDADNNGAVDSGETLLAGLPVKLYKDMNSNGVIDAGDFYVGVTTTDAGGQYIFNNLYSGNYLVQVDTTSPNMPSGLKIVSGGANASSLLAVTLATGQNYLTADFGYNYSGKIGDTLFYDTNNSGTQDGIEGGAPGAIVALFNDVNNNGEFDPGTDTIVTTKTTDAGGHFLFDNLPGGNYMVIAEEQTVVAPPSSSNAGLYGYMVGTAGTKKAITLAAGGQNLNADFGFIEAAEVEGDVFHDVNHNGIKDPGEPGIPNVTATLSGTDTNGNAVNLTTTTDATGEYAFLPPAGTYTVTYNAADIDIPATLTDVTTPSSYNFSVAAGGELGGFNFGRDHHGIIGDTIFADADGNGSQGSGEPGLANVTVMLWDSAMTTLLDTAVTDSIGHYYFQGLPAATYKIQVLTSSLPSNYGTTPTADPDAVKDSIGTAVLSGGGTVLTMDFGYKIPTPTFSVSGVVWDDNGAGGGGAGNGVKSGTEPGLANVTVTAGVDTNADGTVDQTLTTTTDGTGAYSFAGIPSGSNVTITVNTGTLPNVAYVQTGDPDVTKDNKTTITNLIANATNKNFGYNQSLGSITGKYVVGNGNGIADVGEPGLNGITITLTYAGPDGILGTADDTTQNTATIASGAYTFSNLLPGAYQLTKVTNTPSGYASLADSDGANPDNISATLAVGQNLTAQDFEASAVVISGKVWDDADGSANNTFTNINTGAEVGTNATSQVFAILVNGSGNVVQSTPVANNGTYAFSTVTPASYTIRLATSAGTVGQPAPVAAVPSGWTNTSPLAYPVFAVAAIDVTGKDFGIEQPPTANAVNAASQLNPGGTTQVTVATLSGTDPEDPTVTTFMIKTLPVNGTLYYNSVAVTLGQTIPNYNSTLLKVDPIDGSVTVSFTYSVVDAAGKESAPATVTMPFTSLSLSGNVFNDANGLTDSIVNGTGTNVGGALYANLVTGGNVAQSVAVAADGTYSFGTVVPNTSYTVVLSTTLGTVGNAAPAAALPAGWVNTGENLGAGAGNDGTINGTLAVNIVITSVTNANFGIEQPPTAIDVSAAAQFNPGGTSKVTVPNLSGSDPEDSSVTTFVVKTLPSNGLLYYNGTAVTAGQSITSYNPTLLMLDPNDGAITCSFTYASVDAAGKESAPATVTMPFTDPLANPKGGCYNKLLETSFGLDSGTTILINGEPFQLVKVADATKPAGYRIDARVREVSGLFNTTFTLEYISSLSSSGANGAGWSSLAASPSSTTNNGDGTITAIYQDVELLTGISSGQGFMRVKVTYASVSARTGTWGWSRRTATQNVCQTLSMPYTEGELFCGTVTAASVSTLTMTTSVGNGDIKTAMQATGRAYYIEVVNGTYAGHRFEVDINGSTATTLALVASSPLNTLTPVPALAAGDFIKLHPHWTLDQLCDKTKFNATIDSTTADKLTFFNKNTQAFEIYYLVENTSAPIIPRKWVLDGDATLTDAGSRLNDPAEGMFITARSANPNVDQLFTGSVRSHAFAVPLKTGNNLIGSGWPMDQSPVSRVMTAGGFTGSPNPALADLVQTWQPDFTGTSSASYIPYFLLKTLALNQWTQRGVVSAPNANNTVLFKMLRGTMIRSISGFPNYVQPLPWTP